MVGTDSERIHQSESDDLCGDDKPEQLAVSKNLHSVHHALRGTPFTYASRPFRCQQCIYVDAVHHIIDGTYRSSEPDMHDPYSSVGVADPAKRTDRYR